MGIFGRLLLCCQKAKAAWQSSKHVLKVLFGDCHAVLGIGSKRPNKKNNPKQVMCSLPLLKYLRVRWESLQGKPINPVPKLTNKTLE